MLQLPEDLQAQLFSLVDRLRAESADYQQQHADQQQWYNRGYANGMLLGMLDLGLEPDLGGRRPDAPDGLQGHEVMAWGKAYRHGEAMGRKELHEIVQRAG